MNNFFPSEEVANFINNRTVSTIILSILSMLVCQILKFIIFSIRERRPMYRTLITTGGMPSSHTSCVTTLVVSLGFFQLHDNHALEYTFAVAVVFASIVIHDAMGVRLEASKHAKILNNLVKEEDEQTKQELGFGKKGYLKELLGHKGFEVFAGLIVGIIIGVFGSWLFL